MVSCICTGIGFGDRRPIGTNTGALFTSSDSKHSTSSSSSKSSASSSSSSSEARRVTKVIFELLGSFPDFLLCVVFKLLSLVTCSLVSCLWLPFWLKSASHSEVEVAVFGSNTHSGSAVCFDDLLNCLLKYRTKKKNKTQDLPKTGILQIKINSI